MTIKCTIIKLLLLILTKLIQYYKNVSIVSLQIMFKKKIKVLHIFVKCVYYEWAKNTF